MSWDMSDIDAAHLDTEPAFNADALAAELRMSEFDKNFALAILSGANLAQAARMAGSDLEGLKLRKKASDLHKTRRIKEFLRQARLAGKDEVIPIMDRETRKRILSADAAGNDPARRQSAIKLLNEMEQAENSEDDFNVPPPQQILDELAEIGPQSTIIAIELALKNNIDWIPPNARLVAGSAGGKQAPEAHNGAGNEPAMANAGK